MRLDLSLSRSVTIKFSDICQFFQVWGDNKHLVRFIRACCSLSVINSSASFSPTLMPIISVLIASHLCLYFGSNSSIMTCATSAIRNNHIFKTKDLTPSCLFSDTRNEFKSLRHKNSRPDHILVSNCYGAAYVYLSAK